MSLRTMCRKGLEDNSVDANYVYISFTSAAQKEDYNWFLFCLLLLCTVRPKSDKRREMKSEES